MAITYNINILNLRGKPEVDGLQKVITGVEYILEGKEGDDKYGGSIAYANFELNKENFIDFENITKDNIKQWVAAHPSYEVHKDIVNKSIEQQITPTDVVMKKLWK